MKISKNLGEEFEHISRLQIDAYNSRCSFCDVYINSQCTLLQNYVAQIYHSCTILFPIPTDVHDIKGFNFIIKNTMLMPLFESEMPNFFIDNLINICVQTKPLYLEIDINFVKTDSLTICTTIEQIFTLILCKNFNFKLSNEKQKELQKLIFEFNEEQSIFDNLIHLQEYKELEINEMINLLIKSFVEFTRTKRFSVISTSNNSEFQNNLRNALLKIQYVEVTKYEWSKVNQELFKEKILNEKRQKVGEDEEECEIETISYVGEVFNNIFVNGSLDIIGQWFAAKNGPICEFLRENSIPELICSELKCKVKQIEKFLFLVIKIESVPQEFADVLLSLMENLLKNPLDSLIKRSLNIFDHIVERQLLEMITLEEYHEEIVSDVMYALIDPLTIYNEVVQPIKVFGPFEYYKEGVITKVIDYWSQLSDKPDALEEYLNIKENNKIIKDLIIEIPNVNNTNNQNPFVDPTFKRVVLPIALFLTQKLRISYLLAGVKNTAEFVEYIISILISIQRTEITLLVSPKFHPLSCILDRISQHKRLKSSLTDESKEIFIESELKTQYFEELLDSYRDKSKTLSPDQWLETLSEYAQKQVLFNTYYINVKEAESNFINFYSLDTAGLSDDQAASLECVSELEKSLIEYYEEFDKEELVHYFELKQGELDLFSVVRWQFNAKIIEDSNQKTEYFENDKLLLNLYEKIEQHQIHPNDLCPYLRVKLSILFDTSFINRDVEYIVVIYTYMLNEIENFVHFDYFDDSICVQVDTHVPDFELIMQSIILLINKQFTIDDYAAINKREIFLGISQLLQKICFAGAKVEYDLQLQSFDSYILNPENEQQLLFNDQINQLLRRSLLAVIAGVERFDAELKKLYSPEAFQPQRQSSIIRNSSEQLQIITNIRLYNSLSPYETLLLQSFYRSIFEGDSNIGHFRQQANYSLRYVDNELYADVENCKNFILFLTLQGLENSINNANRFSAIEGLLYSDYAFLYNFRAISDIDGVLRQCPLSIENLHITLTVPDFLTDKQLQKIIDQTFSFGIAHEFHVSEQCLCSLFNASKLNSSAIPEMAARLIAKLENLVYKGIQILSIQNIQQLRLKQQQLQRLKERTVVLKQEYQICIDGIADKRLFDEKQQSANEIIIQQESDKEGVQQIQQITVNIPSSAQLQSHNLLSQKLQISNSIHIQAKQLELLNKISQLFPIKQGTIGGVPFIENLEQEQEIIKVYRLFSTPEFTNLELESTPTLIRPIINTEIAAQETAILYICTFLEMLTAIFNLQLRHNFLFPELMLIQNIPNAGLPIGISILQGYIEQMENINVRTLHEKSLTQFLKFKQFGSILPITGDYLPYAQYNNCIQTLIIENIAFLMEELNCESQEDNILGLLEAIVAELGEKR